MIGVLARVVDEYFLEVGTACGEDDLVSADGGVLAHDGAVNKRLILKLEMSMSKQFT